jgi:hypothetical protein
MLAAMFHFIRSGAVACALALAAACGGGSASSQSESGGGTSTSGGGSDEGTPVAQPTNAGTAGQGDPCDFGGATHMTCGAGLHCCYPETGEVAYGTCTADCPGYE